MKHNCFKILILTLSFQYILFRSLHSQTGDLKFEHITTEEGLSSNTVYDIIQDRGGFMWFATQDGLSRYDGYTFKEFKYDPLDTTSITASWATCICEAKDGKLWIGTVYGGVNVFDPTTEKFIHYKHDPANPNSLSDYAVFAIVEDRFGAKWIGTYEGLDKLNPPTTTQVISDKIEPSATEDIKFVHYKHIPTDPISINKNQIWRLMIDNKDMLWIGTDNSGLITFDILKKEFICYKHDPHNDSSISSNRVRQIYNDGNKTWIATLSGGLNLFDDTRETFVYYKNDPSNPNSLSSNDVTDVLKDKSGTLWISTKRGLNKMIHKSSPDKRKLINQKIEYIDPIFINYQHNPSKPQSLSQDWIYTLYEDKAGVIWLGTIGGGVNKFVPEKKKFNNFFTQFNHVTVPIVHSLYEDEAGRLWAGTNNGVYQYDEQKVELNHYVYDPNNSNSLSLNIIYCIFSEIDSIYQTVWFGTWGRGLDRLVLSKDARHNNIARYTHFKHDSTVSNSISSNFIQTIAKDKTGALWIGTENGLNKFDPTTETFVCYKHQLSNSNSLSQNRVNTIFHDPEDIENVLWIGTEGGLDKFNVAKNIFIHYKHDPSDSNSLSYNLIRSIQKDTWSRGKRLWIGTWGGGLNYFDKEAGKFSHFTEKDGLVNNSIYGILEDKKGNLWLSTKEGISRFDRQSKSFRNYDLDDGLMCYLFNRGAYYKSKDEEMFFGAKNGFVAFYPDSIKDNLHIPPIVIMDFKIFNKSAKFKKSISLIKEIKLSHKQNFFSFQFAALDYTDPIKNQYAYKLQGLDRDWVYSGNRNVAYYTDIKPGTYNFRVKGSNNDGIWNKEGTSVKIIIAPPFWETWWFYSLMGIFIIGLLAWGYHVRISRLIRQRNAQQAFSKQLIEAGESERKRIANELHDSLGQNLLITKNEITECLNAESLPDICARNLKEISSLVSESIHEVREIAYNLHPHQLDRLGLTKAIESIVNKVFHSSTTIFSLEIENVDDLVPKDKEIHIYRIIQEGLSNVIRHANAKNVLVTISRAGDTIKILIKDDGNGFDQKKYGPESVTFSGLGLAGIAERVKILNGDWNIESARNKGTSLKIIISIKG